MGTLATVAKIPFKLKGQIEKIFVVAIASSRLGTKRNRFAENISYKFRLLRSSTGTNIQEYVSNRIN